MYVNTRASTWYTFQVFANCKVCSSMYVANAGGENGLQLAVGCSPVTCYQLLVLGGALLYRVLNIWRYCFPCNVLLCLDSTPTHDPAPTLFQGWRLDTILLKWRHLVNQDTSFGLNGAHIRRLHCIASILLHARQPILLNCCRLLNIQPWLLACCVGVTVRWGMRLV